MPVAGGVGWRVGPVNRDGDGARADDHPIVARVDGEHGLHGHGGSAGAGEISVQEDDPAMHGGDGLCAYSHGRTWTAEHSVALRRPNDSCAPAGGAPLGADLRARARPAQFPDLTPGLRLIAAATGGDIDGAAQIEEQ